MLNFSHIFGNTCKLLYKNSFVNPWKKIQKNISQYIYNPSTYTFRWSDSFSTITIDHFPWRRFSNRATLSTIVSHYYPHPLFPGSCRLSREVRCAFSFDFSLVPLTSLPALAVAVTSRLALECILSSPEGFVCERRRVETSMSEATSPGTIWKLRAGSENHLSLPTRR